MFTLPARLRGLEYVKELEKKDKSSVLLKHVENNHPNEEVKFTMVITQIFKDPLSRQGNETVQFMSLKLYSILSPIYWTFCLPFIEHFVSHIIEHFISYSEYLFSSSWTQIGGNAVTCLDWLGFKSLFSWGLIIFQFFDETFSS